MNESSFSEKPYQASVRTLHPSLVLSLTRFIFQVGPTHQQPSSYTKAPYFQSKLSFLLDLCQSRKALWVSERKGLTAARIHWWMGNNGTPCVILRAPPNPSRPTCRNPLFRCFVRSLLLPQICFVSFGAGTLRRPDQHGCIACQQGEKKGGGNARNVVIVAVSRNKKKSSRIVFVTGKR